MQYELKELSLSMGRPEYDMYQDIPAKESGSTNLCHGLPYEIFLSFIESQMARKFQDISEFDTPTIIYIMYVDDYPVGYIGIRIKINEQWQKWSGNIFYAIRKSERSKGYAIKMLELTLNKLREEGWKEVFLQSSAGNIASQKTIEHNGGVLLNEDGGTRYYKIKL